MHNQQHNNSIHSIPRQKSKPRKGRESSRNASQYGNSLARVLTKNDGYTSTYVGIEYARIGKNSFLDIITMQGF